MRHETKAYKNVLTDLMVNRSTHECTGTEKKTENKSRKMFILFTHSNEVVKLYVKRPLL